MRERRSLKSLSGEPFLIQSPEIVPFSMWRGWRPWFVVVV